MEGQKDRERLRHLWTVGQREDEKGLTEGQRDPEKGGTGRMSPSV